MQPPIDAQVIQDDPIVIQLRMFDERYDLSPQEAVGLAKVMLARSNSGGLAKAPAGGKTLVFGREIGFAGGNALVAVLEGL